MYSLAAEQDVDVEDDLARAQRRLRDLKSRISAQSKKNFVLERDVRYLDSRIALLIQNRMAAEERKQVAETLEDTEEGGAGAGGEEYWLDERKQNQYANLFFLLQSEPRHVASLCRLVSLTEIDTLLQTVMFTLYGNQYEQREEHLLLTMFQVSSGSACCEAVFGARVGGSRRGGTSWTTGSHERTRGSTIGGTPVPTVTTQESPQPPSPQSNPP
jgi:Ras GTPase-activating-like protein IQGAP2/3